MDISTLLLIILIPLAIFLFMKRNKKEIKPAHVKKEEIIEEYKRQMREVLDQNKSDKTKQLQEKTKLLKKINHELSMNLFFDEEESRKIINELLSLS